MRSRVQLSVELDAPGVQVGVAGIEYSDDSHAYGIIPVPIAVLSGKQGPTVLVTGGTHGDEWEGQLLARRLIRTIDPARLHGRLIVLPAHNQPAVLAGRRTSPVDGANLNRAFPGDPDGGPTAMLADFVEHELLASADFAIDLHSGGSASRYLPCAFLRIEGDTALTEEKLAAAEAFGLATTVVVPGQGESRTLSAAADRQRAVMVAAELAGGGAIDIGVLAEADAAVHRLLAHWKVIEPETWPEGQAAPTTFLRLAAQVTVPVDGLLEPTAVLGDEVEQGDVVALVHRVDDPSAPPLELLAPVRGVITITRIPPLVRAGSHACTIGSVVARSDVAALGS